MTADWIRQEHLLPSTTFHVRLQAWAISAERKSVVLVVVPLVALMVDQVQSL